MSRFLRRVILTETIIFSKEGSIARISLNNPAKHNALGSKELLTIRRHLSDIEKKSSVRVLVLSSTNNTTFCAGASLEELRNGDITSNDFQSITDLLAEAKIPTVCAINGNLFGGGVELALSCDFRIAIRNIKMRVPASALGLCYPISGIHRYVERLGHNAAKRILLAAESFSDSQLLEMGFVERIEDSVNFDTVVNQYAVNLSELAPLAVQAMKQIINKKSSGKLTYEEAEKLALECNESQDVREGFIAQREKRKPVFKGF